MREILFRGKRVDNGKWVEGWLKPFLNKGYIGEDSRLCIQNGTRSYNIFEVIPETVGQYTGRIDANGKKIFEGDIVQHEQDGERHIEIAVLDPNILPVGYTYRWLLYSNEVIGNVFDDTELIPKEIIPIYGWFLDDCGIMPSEEEAAEYGKNTPNCQWFIDNCCAIIPDKESEVSENE